MYCQYRRAFFLFARTMRSNVKLVVIGGITRFWGSLRMCVISLEQLNGVSNE